MRQGALQGAGRRRFESAYEVALDVRGADGGGGRVTTDGSGTEVSEPRAAQYFSHMLGTSTGETVWQNLSVTMSSRASLPDEPSLL